MEESPEILYIWKMPRPRNEEYAKSLMRAAYNTAMEADPTVTTILIRSNVHASTQTGGGGFVEDDPHITISTKNPTTEASGHHRSSHGYTEDADSFDVIRVTTKKKCADSKGTAWPKDISKKQTETFKGEPQ